MTKRRGDRQTASREGDERKEEEGQISKAAMEQARGAGISGMVRKEEKRGESACERNRVIEMTQA
eukprot:6193081-Pleurochrysis_carterae.AAC.1